MFFALNKSVILVIKKKPYGEILNYHVTIWAQDFTFPVSILVG